MNLKTIYILIGLGCILDVVSTVTALMLGFTESHPHANPFISFLLLSGTAFSVQKLPAYPLAKKGLYLGLTMFSFAPAVWNMLVLGGLL